MRKVKAHWLVTSQTTNLCSKETTNKKTRVHSYLTLTANAALPARAVHYQDTHNVHVLFFCMLVKHDIRWPKSMLLPVCRQSRTSFESIPASSGFPRLDLYLNIHKNTCIDMLNIIFSVSSQVLLTSNNSRLSVIKKLNCCAGQNHARIFRRCLGDKKWQCVFRSLDVAI